MNNTLLCKLCGSKEHSLGTCNEFVTFEQKTNRLNELS